ncbi:TPA: hypothetical protein ACTUO5_001568 [Legionella pneumophila]
MTPKYDAISFKEISGRYLGSIAHMQITLNQLISFTLGQYKTL